jgi:hypothetical protein
VSNLLPTYNQVIIYVYEQFCLCFDGPKISLEELKTLCESSENEIEELLNLNTLKPVGRVNFKSFHAPVFFASENYQEKEVVKQGKVQFDVFLNSFLLLSGWQEWMCESTDKQDRFPYSCSLQHKFDFVKIPAVTIYFEFLAQVILEKGLECKAKRFDSNVIFTHDIDQVRSGWFEDIGYFIKNPSFKGVFKSVNAALGKILGNKDSYHLALLKMQGIDKKNNLPAISFMMTEKSHDDADYDLKNLLALDLDKSQRIGLHPGFETYNNKENFSKQLEKLIKLYPSSEKIVRQHYLKYNVKQTNKIHEELQIKEDYSLGFAEHYGFRNSIATPFHLYRFDENRASKVLEVPLYFMDGTLHHYLNDTSWKGKEGVVKEVETLYNELNISFSVLFHNSVFTDQKYKGFTAMYEKLINIVQEGRLSL